MNLNDLKKEYPSLCYTCKRARKPWSDGYRLEGLVGCTILVDLSMDYYDSESLKGPYEKLLKDIDSPFLATGWVDLKCSIDADEDSGIVTNFQLLTREVQNCPYYDPENYL